MKPNKTNRTSSLCKTLALALLVPVFAVGLFACETTVSVTESTTTPLSGSNNSSVTTSTTTEVPPGPSSRSPAESEIVRISIINASDIDGLAGKVGEYLRNEGFTFENGYTIDISSSEMINESAILIDYFNDKKQYDEARDKAQPLQELLGFSIYASAERFQESLKLTDEITNENTIIIILGQYLVHDNRFEFLLDLPEAPYEYTPMDSVNGKVLQIEPHEE